MSRAATASVLSSSLAAIVALLVSAAVAPPAYRRWPRAVAIAVTTVSAACFALFVAHAGAIARGQALTEAYAWVPSLGIAAAFRVDGLALVFALLITGIGAIILAYTPGYCRRAPGTGRLLGLLLSFEAAMLGLVTADDTITLFVFWEGTSFASFFLIAFDSESQEARTRARQALVITSAGGLVLLVGLLVLATAAEPGAGVSISLAALADTDAGVRSHPHYTAIVVLIAIGAFTKSAQVPFHFWLPGAMVAPTPVSAYLHSATMVNAGIYVLARLYPTLGGTPLWIGLLATVGTATFVVAALLAIVQRDAKLVLAYATVSALGAMVLLLGIGTTAALGGLVVFLLAHACYKAALFLTVGNLDHHRGTRDPFAPIGERRDMPFTASAALLAGASMAGVPPLVGYIGKDAIYAAALDGPLATLVTICAVLAGTGFVTAAWIAAAAPYLRGRRRWSRDDVPATMLVGPALLSVASLVLGLMPDIDERWLIAPAAAAVAGRPIHYDVALWHGLSGHHGLAFGLGLVSIALGVFVAAVVWRRRDQIGPLRERITRLSGERAHEATLDGLTRLARRLAHTVQHGRLPLYVATVLVVTVVAVGVPLAAGTGRLLENLELRTNAYEVPLLLIAAASAVATAVFRHRLSSVAALNATGLMVTFLFALYSGPDLAITQLTVETMMLILFVLLFRRIGPSQTRERATGRAARLVIALASGVLVSVLLLLATSTAGISRTAASEHVRLAPEQHFKNVVNAIIVDFRALDTLGEITVITIAGIGVAALARARGRAG